MHNDRGMHSSVQVQCLRLDPDRCPRLCHAKRPYRLLDSQRRRAKPLALRASTAVVTDDMAISPPASFHSKGNFSATEHRLLNINNRWASDIQSRPLDIISYHISRQSCCRVIPSVNSHRKGGPEGSAQSRTRVRALVDLVACD